MFWTYRETKKTNMRTLLEFNHKTCTSLPHWSQLCIPELICLQILQILPIGVHPSRISTVILFMMYPMKVTVSWKDDQSVHPYRKGHNCMPQQLPNFGKARFIHYSCSAVFPWASSSHIIRKENYKPRTAFCILPCFFDLSFFTRIVVLCWLTSYCSAISPLHE